ASVAEGRTIKIWDVQSGQELRSIDPQQQIAFPMVGLAFSPDGKRLACAQKMFDAETGEELFPLRGVQSGIVFSPDGKQVVGTNGGGERVLDAQTGQELFALSDSGGSVAFSPNGQRLASARKIWDAQTGQELLSLKGPSGVSGGVAFSPDGHRLG